MESWSTISEPGGRTLTFTYDASGDLTSVTLPDGSMHTYSYDSSGHMLSDSWGNQATTYTYDPTTEALISTNTGSGRTMQQVPASMQGLQTSQASPASDQGMAATTDPLGRVTTYTFDPLGLPTQESTPDGGVQSWQRDFSGQVTAYTDELGRTTSYTYQYGSGDGELTQQTDPEGGVTRYQYNPTFHEVTQQTDPLGRATTYLYNAQGDLTETIDPLGRVTTEVWSNGLLQSETDPLGRTTTYEYNSRMPGDRADRPARVRHDLCLRSGRRPNDGRGPDGAGDHHGLRRDAAGDRVGRPHGPHHHHALRRQR